MNTLDQLVYCSRSQLAPDEEAAAMADIVHVAAFLNARNGITGALTLQDGVFVQCLECSPTALDILMLHLHFDERHEAIEIVARGRIERRAFPAWGMTAPTLGRSVRCAQPPDRSALRRPDRLARGHGRPADRTGLTPRSGSEPPRGAR